MTKAEAKEVLLLSYKEMKRRCRTIKLLGPTMTHFSAKAKGWALLVPEMEVVRRAYPGRSSNSRAVMSRRKS